MALPQLSVESRRGFVWALFPDTVTVDSGRQIESRLQEKLSGKADRLVFDFSRTSELYSSGIGLLVRLRKKISETGGIVALVNVPKKIRDALVDMHLDRVFPIYATDVEFEISHEEAWRETMTDTALGFLFTAQLEGGVYRLAFAGHMDALHDLADISEFKPDVAVSRYVLNLENLDSMDTYGSQLLLETVQRIAKTGAACFVYGANEMIRELLHLLNIDRLVSHFDTEREALEALGN